MNNDGWRVTETAVYERFEDDQIRRASISISSNIAEGFERGSKRGFVQLLCVAKGSLGEVRSQLQVSSELGYIDKEDFGSLL